MKDLLENKNIITKPAYKGSAVVVMDRLDYLKEGFRQLSDATYYARLEHEPTADFRKEVSDFVEDMYQNGEIDESVQKCLMYDTLCMFMHAPTIPTPLNSQRNKTTTGQANHLSQRLPNREHL